MKKDQQNINKIYEPSLLWNNLIKRDFNLLNESFKKNDLNKFLFFFTKFWKSKI